MAHDTQGPYRPIGDYALIGDMHTAALIATNGSLDWCCLPRFDSPAVFCKLLDQKKGGEFRIEPRAQYTCSRSYVGATNVLSMTFSVESGQFRVTDFMPVKAAMVDCSDPVAKAQPRIMRRIEGLSGHCEVEIEFRPTFDFGRTETRIDVHDGKVIARSSEEMLVLTSSIPFELQGINHAHAYITIHEGQRLDLCLCYGNDGLENDADRIDIDLAYAEAIDYWEQWASRCTYRGPYRHLVQRSTLVLKLLTYAPSGAVVAAPTTSLPEEIGGVRNWDYRYTWIRDASLILEAFMSTGYHTEAMQFFDWVEALCIKCCGDLQIMYAVDGSPDLPESLLPHLEGYRQSSPVRVGNEAAQQKQLDIYGELLHTIWLCYQTMRPPRPELLATVRFVADQAAMRWREPDDGIWEARQEPKHYLYSKLQCWVALDRAIKLSKQGGLSADIERWRITREEIRIAILTEGYSEELGAFTQAFGVKTLDASALTMPLTGFLPASDARVQSTMAAIQEQLGAKGVVYRYLGADGLSGGEGAFALCSFWLVDSLAAAGESAEARQLFERIISYGNDVGLFAEQLEPLSGEMLGNYPQGFTHLALIRSAVGLEKAEKQKLS